MALARPGVGKFFRPAIRPVCLLPGSAACGGGAMGKAAKLAGSTPGNAGDFDLLSFLCDFLRRKSIFMAATLDGLSLPGTGGAGPVIAGHAYGAGAAQTSAVDHSGHELHGEPGNCGGASKLQHCPEDSMANRLPAALDVAAGERGRASHSSLASPVVVDAGAGGGGYLALARQAVRPGGGCGARHGLNQDPSQS